MLTEINSVPTQSMLFGLTYMHPARAMYNSKYVLIRDCLTNNVKPKKHKYLPDPSELDEDPKFKEHRYRYYHERAQWMPATKRTLQALVAQVFTQKPVLRDDGLDKYFLQSPSVSGDSLNGLANYGLSENVGMGRGAYVVWCAEGDRPIVDFIEAESIITWSDLPYGRIDEIGRNIESITVRTFTTTTRADGITVELYATVTQFKLDTQGFAWSRSMRETLLGQSTSFNQWQKLLIKGKPIKHIPVFIQGAERNVLALQSSPLEELAELNISHYISSADYQEHAKLAGQVTTVLTGLKQDWYDKNIKGQVAFGARRPIPLGDGAKASLLQAQPNSVSKEALGTTESMMVAVGARLIEQRQVRRTATEADIEAQSYHSILGHIAINTSDAMTLCLRHVALYFGAVSIRESTAIISLNNDFSATSTSAEHRRLLLEEYIAGVRSFDEYRTALRKYDSTLDTDDKKARLAIEADIDMRTKLANITAKPSGDNRTQPPTQE